MILDGTIRLWRVLSTERISDPVTLEYVNVQNVHDYGDVAAHVGMSTGNLQLQSAGGNVKLWLADGEVQALLRPDEPAVEDRGRFVTDLRAWWSGREYVATGVLTTWRHGRPHHHTLKLKTSETANTTKVVRRPPLVPELGR